MLLSSRKVLIVLEDPRGPIYKSLSSEARTLSPCPYPPITSPCLCPWATKSSKTIKNFAFCKESVMYEHVIHKFGYRHRA